MMREGMASAKLALAFAFRRPENSRTSIDDTRLKDAKTRALYSAIAQAEEAMGFPARQAAPRVLSAGANLVAANAFALRAGPVSGGYQPGAGRPASATTARREPQAAASPTPAYRNTLHQAHALADSGALSEAAAVARAYLGANPSSAGAYYLLGVIADAQGRQTEARGHYKRALYLDPEHGEALTHLAAVLGLEGDRTGAQLLLARAARAGRVSGGRDE
jgi:chemotaxis protein methyltransferase WspC